MAAPGNIRKKAERLVKERRWSAALVLYLQLTRQQPEDHESWLSLGSIYLQLGDLKKAEQVLRHVLTQRPNLLPAYEMLAQLLLMQGRLHEAESNCRTAVALAPGSVAARYQLGRVLQQQGKSSEAVTILREVIAAGYNGADVELLLGRALAAQGSYDAALCCYHNALALQPNSAEINVALADLHRDRREFTAALTAYQRADQLKPEDHGSYLLSVAQLYEYQASYGEALALLDEAISGNLALLDVHWRRAELLLLLGRYSEGWSEYEWRLQHPRWIAAMGECKFAAPRWQGQPLAGKTILIYAEQGFGDTLQFSRYLALLKERGATIIFYCDKELLPLYQQCEFEMRVEPKSYFKALTESVDYHSSLMSLPHWCGTTLENIPAHTPYLQPPDERRRHWQQRLAGDGVKVGLVWAGRETHGNNRRRSCGLALLAPLAAVAGLRFYSLQKGAAELSGAEIPAGMVIEDLAPELNDFGDTAAAIEQLDLVITVDTAVAHLAGALGKPVWTLIYFPTEWRWLLQRDDSPWYPTMRLFRQAAAEPDWTPVIQRLTAALTAFVTAR